MITVVTGSARTSARATVSQNGKMKPISLTAALPSVR